MRGLQGMQQIAGLMQHEWDVLCRSGHSQGLPRCLLPPGMLSPPRLPNCACPAALALTRLARTLMGRPRCTTHWRCRRAAPCWRPPSGPLPLMVACQVLSWRQSCRQRSWQPGASPA